MNEKLETNLKKLRLSGMAMSLDVRLQEATANHLTHAEFLELVLQDELAVRFDRLVSRRVKAASFREVKRLDDFDWTFNPSIKKKQMYDLAAGHFLRQGRDVLMLGPPGTGKSFLAQAIGHQLIHAGFTVYYRSVFDVVRDFLRDQAFDGQEKVLSRYLKPDLVIIDDMGMKELPKKSGEFLFEIIMRRYEVRSTMMTSNRPIPDWGKLIGDVPAATAILDRFLHHAEMIQITGRSYRLRKQQSGLTTEKQDHPSDRSTDPPDSKTGQSAPRVAQSKTGQSAHRTKQATGTAAAKKAPSKGK
jgi:DNA replication protein DnaC